MADDETSNFHVEVFETTRDSPMVVITYEIIPRVPPDLSPAEAEVVLFMMRGLSNSDIAAARGTSVHTIANQVAEVFQKLGVNTRAELALKLWEACAECGQQACTACHSAR